MFIPSIVYGIIYVGAQSNTSKPYPIVTTNAATSITDTTATLNGTAYNYNSAGTYYFNYGLTSSYGTQSTPVVFAGNTTTTSFSTNITGLTTGSLYHFQACVSNTVGSTCGSDLTFTPNNPLVRLASLTVSGGATAGLNGMFIDNASTFLYACTGGSVANLDKISLSSFTQTGTYISINNNCNNGILDKTNSNYYLHTSSPSNANRFIEKVAVGAMTGSIIITLATGTTAFGNNGTVAIDYVNNKIYWPHVNATSTQQINRIDIASNTWDATINAYGASVFFDTINTIWSGSVTAGPAVQKSTAVPFTAGSLTSGNPGLSSSVVIDSNTGSIYFGNEQNNQIILLNTSGLSTSGFVSSLCLSGTLAGIAIDSIKGYIYFNCISSPMVLGAVRISDGSIAQRLTLSSGENLTGSGYTSLAVDITNHNLYVGTSSNKLIKVQLN